MEGCIDTSQATLKVCDQAPDDRPQERALEHGVSTLSTADLWALILRTGQPGVPITSLCRELMRSVDGSLLMLERRSRQQIMETKGIGVVKALQIEAVMQLVSRHHNEFMASDNRMHQVRTSADLYDYMKHRNANLPHEEIWIVLLNRAHCIMSARKVTEGGAAASLFDVKKTIKTALLEDAQAVVLCHNHPSGQLRPSVQDDNITRQFKAACDTVDLRMLDHIIVTHTGYYSYNDQGRL